MNWTVFLMLLQVFFSVVIGLYFWNLLKNQQTSRTAIDREIAQGNGETSKIARHLPDGAPFGKDEADFGGRDYRTRGGGEGPGGGPVRPQSATRDHLRAAGSRQNRRRARHSGRGEENPLSPFNAESKFVEIDATTARFDERGIADPLIGSVHDPIYQGAGAMGVAGIPQPKPGAVTKAHGGILFIDEIGELHPIQMNKLLKVLEDRKVFLESAYYNPEDSNIPSHIHDIFQNGLPADFRLIGATTRMPEEIPPAIRSRCVEIFFRPLRAKEIGEIARQALKRTGVRFEEEVIRIIQKYATNGREVVNIVQTAVGLAFTEKRNQVLASDVEWVVHNSQLSPRPELKMPDSPQVGVATGLAVSGPNMSTLLEVEVTAVPAERKGGGSLRITGVVDEEELGGGSRTLRRKSMAKGSVENVMTVLRRNGFSPDDYHLHVNFPGGVPVDGPSAGVTIAAAIVSAIRGIPVDNRLAMTGELSIHGRVKPVGGVVAKVDAARQAGASRVIIPEENMQSLFGQMEGIEVIPVRRLEEVLDLALLKEETVERERSLPAPGGILSASTTPV